MWKCPVCGTESSNYVEYCINCGTRMQETENHSANYTWTCKKCGTICAGDTNFCEKCGTPRSGNPEPKHDKKKYLWLIFGIIAVIAGIVIICISCRPDPDPVSSIEVKVTSDPGSTESAADQSEVSVSPVTSDPDPTESAADQSEVSVPPVISSAPIPAGDEHKMPDIGDTLIFGQYEQDNDLSNGYEDIEWIVLAREDDRILVISRYGLDCVKYNSVGAEVTWETCSMRTWLNETFIFEAFNTDERSKIAEVTVNAEKNPAYSTSAGNSTKDQLFVLSIDEANKYFSSDKSRMCIPTAYAKTAAYTSEKHLVENQEACWWWLRTPGNSSYKAASVYPSGKVYLEGDGVKISHYCVRPVMWLEY